MGHWPEAISQKIFFRDLGITGEWSNRRDAGWRDYLVGLKRAYQPIGASSLVPSTEVDPEFIYWIFRDQNGRVLGGFRIGKPIRGPKEAKSFFEDILKDSFPLVEKALGCLLENSFVEVRGAWSDRTNNRFHHAFRRAVRHSLTIADVRWATASAEAKKTLRIWTILTGARKIQGIPDFKFPTPKHTSALICWERRDLEAGIPSRQWKIESARILSLLRDWDEPLFQIQLFECDDPEIERITAVGADFIDLYPAMKQELDLLRPKVPVSAEEEAPCVVWYPWRNSLARVLGPVGFRRLRLDRNRNKITHQQSEELKAKSVGVVGLSVGYSAAFVLAQEGLCGKLRIADFDSLDLSNLNRIPMSILDLNLAKCCAAARRLFELDPYIEVEAFCDGVTRENVSDFVHGLDLIVEECDSLDVKILVREAASRARVAVVMETNDRGMLDIERYDTDEKLKPFHGLVGELNADILSNLSTEDKVPYLLDILDASEISEELGASLFEINATLNSWPQLASDVALGGALVGNVSRKILLGDTAPAGRLRVDLDAKLKTASFPRKRHGYASTVRSEMGRPEYPLAFREKLETAASWAPSGGNMQPWRFSTTGNRFRVHLHPKTLVGLDVGMRGSAVACGAALANASALAASEGRIAPGDAQFFYDVNAHDDVLCELVLGDSTDAALSDLADAVSSRFTNRQHDTPGELEANTLDWIQDAACSYGVSANYRPSGELSEIADLWAASDRIRLLSDRLRREMMEELVRPDEDEILEGIDERTLELPSSEVAKLELLRRDDVLTRLAKLNLGHRLGDDVRKKIHGSSGMIMFTAPGNALSDFATGGFGMQCSWLKATQMGIYFQPISPVFGYFSSLGELESVLGPAAADEMWDAKERANRIFGVASGHSQILTVRLHSGQPPTFVSGRRPI